MMTTAADTCTSLHAPLCVCVCVGGKVEQTIPRRRFTHTTIKILMKFVKNNLSEFITKCDIVKVIKSVHRPAVVDRMFTLVKTGKTLDSLTDCCVYLYRRLLMMISIQWK